MNKPTHLSHNNIEEEVWKDIPNYEGIYQASTLGNIRSIGFTQEINNQWGSTSVRHKKGRVLKQHINTPGYYSVQVSKDRITKRIMTHRLVAITFIPNPENKREVNHKDSNKLNNRLDNLEWVTPKENNQHYILLGRKRTPLGMDTHNAVLTEEIVKEIYLSTLTPKKLSEKLNINKSTISSVKQGVNWRWLTSTLNTESIHFYPELVIIKKK